MLIYLTGEYKGKGTISIRSAFLILGTTLLIIVGFSLIFFSKLNPQNLLSQASAPLLNQIGDTDNSPTTPTIISFLIQDPQCKVEPCTTKGGLSQNSKNCYVVGIFGQIQNTGNTTLNSFNVASDKPANIYTLNSLDPNASTVFSGTYLPSQKPASAFITVSAQDNLGNLALATTTAFCISGDLIFTPLTPSAIIRSILIPATTPVATTPTLAISINQSCTNNAGIVGQAITFSGTLKNTGSVTLYNLTIVSDKAGQVLFLNSLVPQASADYTGSYTPSQIVSTNMVTATGVDETGHTVTVTAQASSTCEILITSPGELPVSSTPSNNPKLTVTKVVVNTGGGTKGVSDFPLFVDGSPVTSGVQNTLSTGSHTVSETEDPDYTAVISGDCATNGTITLAAGDNKTCTITNTLYVAPTGPEVTKYCDYEPFIGQFTCDFHGSNEAVFSFTGTITNNNSSVMTITSITDNPVATIIVDKTTLNPSESTSYTATYTMEDCVCDIYADTVTVNATVNGVTVSTTVNVVDPIIEDNYCKLGGCD